MFAAFFTEIKMSRVSIFIIFLFMLSACTSPRATDSPAEKPASAKVDVPADTLIEINYTVAKERNSFQDNYLGDKAKYLSERDAYDEHEHHVEHIRFSPTGTIEEYIVYVYNNGVITEDYRLEKSFQEEVLYKTNWLYDENNVLTSKVGYTFRKNAKSAEHDLEITYEDRKTWGQKTTEVFIYTDKGLLREQKLTNPSGSITSEVYTYDSLGRTVIQDTWKDGQLMRKLTTSYFTDSTVTRCQFTAYPDAPASATCRVFDKHKNVVSEKHTDQHAPFTRLYTYNAENQLVKQEYITNTGYSIFTGYTYTVYDTAVTRTFTVSNR